jgi:hypothetical protein
MFGNGWISMSVASPETDPSSYWLDPSAEEPEVAKAAMAEASWLEKQRADWMKSLHQHARIFLHGKTPGALAWVPVVISREYIAGAGIPPQLHEDISYNKANDRVSLSFRFTRDASAPLIFVVSEKGGALAKVGKVREMALDYEAILIEHILIGTIRAGLHCDPEKAGDNPNSSSDRSGIKDRCRNLAREFGPATVLKALRTETSSDREIPVSPMEKQALIECLLTNERQH